MLLSSFQPLAAIATTPNAVTKLQPLGIKIWVPISLRDLDNVQVYQGSLQACLASLWENHQGLVFCLATGAAVRLIAPLLKDKSSDPGVVVLDQEGRFVISLCSGHQGGADVLTRLIAKQLGATPILTGAAASLDLPGIDVMGLPFGWRKGEGDWTGVSAAVARTEVVEVIQEVGSTLWQKHLPPKHSFQFGFPELGKNQVQPQGRIWISFTKRRFSPETDIPKVQWHPRVLWVGMGCERGTSQLVMETALEEVFQRYHLATEAIAGIATIDLKADELGILSLCKERSFPLQTFQADALEKVTVPTPSPVVNQEVGTPSVAEAAAILATQNPSLLVPKQIFRLEGEAGAVTVAVAQSQWEYTGGQGKLFLVGMGPGDLGQMTPTAQTAVTEADAIIGYSLYLNLIKPLRRPGQIQESFPITQERQRAQRAIELANWGLTVAVVSSGDAGIYGMAGLVMEELEAGGWDGETPGVTVFPGISALQAAAARVGTPLMHDFCAISLSDLLTPWEVIAKRLAAAAQADFVTAIYNPRSQSRTKQIEIAQKTFLKYRDANTPVALVRSAYRQDEEIIITTLGKMLEHSIDMLTTVLIGNCSTQNYANWLITPRGYNKSVGGGSGE
ncbi:MAG: precorrin-3B C(17)-methyltransferase [Spirulinaceae cyanobacterium]